ncbi:MAG TPA: hypothetical protein PKA82_14895 [Pyrinomonadaceae bacterium]|nr:hypothetical protein [Pyrinomonadaceae bacterium]
MIPSPLWFPTNFTERAAWFANFTSQFTAIGPGLGFTNADIAPLTADNAVMQELVAGIDAAESYIDAVRAYRKLVTEGDVNGTTPSFPPNPTSQIGTSVPQGIFERLDNLVKRIRLAPGYSIEEGELLGIVPSTPSNISPETAKPTLTVLTEPGNKVLVKFVKKNFNGILLEMSVDKGPQEDKGRFNSSPAIITVPQNENELPRLVAVRARFLVGNDPVGEWSDTVTVQTTP